MACIQLHRRFPSRAGAFRPPISSSVFSSSRFERLSPPLMVFRQCTDRSAKLRPRDHQLWDDGLFLKPLPSPARFTLKSLIFFTEITILYFVSPFRPFDQSAKLRPRGDPERDDGHSLRFLPSPRRFALQHLIFSLKAFWHASCHHSDSLNAPGPRTSKALQDTFPEDQGDLSQGDRITVTISSAFVDDLPHVCNEILHLSFRLILYPSTSNFKLRPHIFTGSVLRPMRKRDHNAPALFLPLHLLVVSDLIQFQTHIFCLLKQMKNEVNFRRKCKLWQWPTPAWQNRWFLRDGTLVVLLTKHKRAHVAQISTHCWSFRAEPARYAYWLGRF